MNHRRSRPHRKVVPGLILASTLLASSTAVLAINPPQQLGEYAHTAWSRRDGYSLGGVYTVAQTPDGYLWLASEMGLYRFDGEKFIPWQPPPGQKLPNAPYSLLVSRDGTLWIGTYYGFVSWNGVDLTEYPELKATFATTLLEDRDGTIWAGIIRESKGELCEIRAGRAQCHTEDGAFGEFVWSLAQDESGALWVGAEKGLWRWKPGPPERFELPGRPADLLVVDGELLVGIRRGGLLHFAGGTLVPYPVTDGSGQQVPDSVIKANKLLRDRDGGIWIGSDAVGVHHVKNRRLETFNVASGLTGDIACSLFEDREGNIWYASEKGLDRFRKLSVNTLWVDEGPNSEITKAVMASSDGGVWVTSADGITRWQDGRSHYYKDVPGLPDAWAQALFEDPRGRIWFGTHGGLVYYDRGRFFPVEGQPDSDIVSISGDETNLWVAGPRALALFQNDRLVGQFDWTEIGSPSRAVAVADRGGVWLGHSVYGGVEFFKDGKTRERYAAADGLGAGHVASLRLDRDGALWAATQSGLSRIQKGRVHTLKHENGLPCNSVYWSMEDDQQNVWLYTTCGLVRVAHDAVDAWIADPSRSVETRRWSAADGVPIRPMPPYYGGSAAKDADGRIWFVSGEGIQVFDPEHLSFNPIPPPVYVDQIVADRKPYPAAKRMRLPPLSRDITLEFTALSLTDAQSLQFRYRLEGHDTEWQEAGNRRQAFYTNLGPGEFRFHVKASNNNGVWNEQGAELRFFIAPAYYQTLWFRLACVAMAAALVWLGFLLHARRVRREEKRLRDVIEGIPSLAFSVYPDGSFDLVNQRWVEYFGLRPGAKSSIDWRSALHPDDVAAHVEKWRAALANGEPFENEARHRSVAGEYRWFLVRAVPLRDANEKIVRWYGTLTDIEERKRAEEERERLRRLEAHLAHTNRLSMLGELTASIAHEINQPIGATIASAAAGMRWLSREEPALREALDAFTRIKDDGKRAADIITGLRAFYKKDASPQRVAVNMNELVHEMLVLLRREADRRSVTMRTELQPDLPSVLANRVQLQQVLMNLMVNAIEAMEEAGGELLIRTEHVDGQLKVSVIDAGVGIPADRMDQIFSAFATTKPTGTGMGLAISRTIVESHEGKLWAEANDGAGATFHFTLPGPGDTTGRT